MKGIFITGTGTDVGKSVITTALCRALWQQQHKVLPVKALQTGCVVGEGDVLCYRAGLQDIQDPSTFSLQKRALHTFALPASPHLAAAQEGQHLEVASLHAGLVALAQKNTTPLIIEGAGGLFVPLNVRETFVDLIQSLALPVLIVMRNTLGALNHALLTLEALTARGLEIVGIVCTECSARTDSNTLIRRDNVAFLRAHTSHTVYEMPFMPAWSAPPTPVYTDTNTWQKAATVLMPLAEYISTYWKTNIHNKNNSTEKSVVTEKNTALLQWDKEHLWHPYTTTHSPLPVYEVTHTQGTRIYLRNGQSLIDGMSSWWCAVHGYGQKKLVAVAQKQLARMSHVMFGGLTHAPAVRSAQKVLELLPQGLERLFWADSGSVAVEVAIKMALQYQQGHGETQRVQLLSPRGGYYGDTLGAMSLCDPINGMHSLFQHVLPTQIFISRPSCRFDNTADTLFDTNATKELEEAFVKHGHTLAALILEPIVQGAGGMWFYHPHYIRRARQLCNEYGVLLIFDEIATGFGRTGKLFAAEWAGVSPDICCVGKALTGGFMSLAATTCTHAVADGICRKGQVFMHGPTFMANPLACSVASASIDILLASPWQENIHKIEQALQQGLEPCRHMSCVADVRVLGGIGVVEMRKPVCVEQLQAFFVQQGVWIRPFGRLIYLMPPYIATHDEIYTLTSAICTALQQNMHEEAITK